MHNLLTPSDIKNATDLILKKVREIIPVEINRSLVTDWAEENRILKEGAFQGPYSYDLSPYLREIADNLSAASDVKETAVMKATRIGATVGLHENWVGYTIDKDPSEMAYITASDDLATAQMDLRIDSLINSSDISEKIGNVEKRKGQKTTGDKVTQKTFPGGYLMAGGPRAPFIKRQFGFKKVAVDETDEFPMDIDKNGDPIGLIRGRVKGYEDTYKILWASSPKLKHNSQIEKLYKEGDQRKYYVECKHCHHMQFMRWGNKKTKGGLKFEHDEDNRLIYKRKKPQIWYECEECEGHWTEEDKEFFIPDKAMGGSAEWRPTATPRRKGMRSYHLPGMYSLISSWESGILDFLSIKNNGFPKNEFQVWVNTFLAETFEDQGERPKIELLLTRERTYKIDTLPPDAKPLFITIGADVQKDRIECEVVAWGVDAESWSINYHVLHGDTLDLDSACYEGMRFLIKKKHAGLPVILTGIDSGYRTDVVYSFCDTFESGVHPVMGTENLNKGRDHIKLFNVPGHAHARIDMNNDLLSQEIYRYINKSQYEDGRYPKGYCHFPVEYTREHFNRLTAEIRIKETTARGIVKHKWDAGQRRNEQHDNRRYGLGMVYAYRLSIETELKNDQQIEDDYSLTWDDFWNYLQS